MSLACACQVNLIPSLGSRRHIPPCPTGRRGCRRWAACPHKVWAPTCFLRIDGLFDQHLAVAGIESTGATLRYFSVVFLYLLYKVLQDLGKHLLLCHIWNRYPVALSGLSICGIATCSCLGLVLKICSSYQWCAKTALSVLDLPNSVHPIGTIDEELVSWFLCLLCTGVQRLKGYDAVQTTPASHYSEWYFSTGSNLWALRL